METAFVGPGRAGPGLAMQRAETGRALNSIRARGPGRAGPWGLRAGPGRADKIRPVQTSVTDRFIQFPRNNIIVDPLEISVQHKLSRANRHQLCFNRFNFS